MSDFLPVYQPEIDGGNELKYVMDCVRSGWVSSLGEYVDRFEAGFAELCEAEAAVAVSNGTVGLHLALRVFDIGPGDEVIVPDLTFVATASAVKHAGATPILADVDPITWTLAPEAVARAITPRTRAVIPVHLYGHPADMEGIVDALRGHDVRVIEDAAEAHGARYRGRRVGALGDAGVFSFYGNKIITTGEGGMLTFKDTALADRARFLKDHAMSRGRRYFHPEVGFNYRLTNLQAALGLAQLERIEGFLDRKRAIADRYADGLADLPGITLQPEADWARNVYWMYSILVDASAAGGRDRLAAALREERIDSRPFFYPLHALPPFEEEDRFPVATGLSERGLNLPSYPGLTDADVDRVCAAIQRMVDGRSSAATDAGGGER